MVSVVAIGLSKHASYMPLETFELEIDPIPEGRSYYQPGDEIRGKLIMNTYDFFYCFGIQVSLEGTATVSYRSGEAIRTRTESLIPFDWATVFFYGSRTNQKEIEIPQSKHTFPFCIPIRKLNPFAGTFKGTSGEIIYTISAYVNSTSSMVRKRTQKMIIVKSYLNLNSMPINNKPVCVESSHHKTIFFKKAKLKYTLNMFQRGFLPGEIIHFRLTVLNLRDKIVSRLSVSLIRKISYMSEVSTKYSTIALESRENTETVDFTDPVIIWEDSLIVPDETHPSTKGLIIRHQYFIRIEVNTFEKDEPSLKGDIPINIGTVREEESQSLLTVEPPIARARSRSLASISSNDSSGAVRIPPPYSQLSTRAPSLESLPPPMYEDAVCLTVVNRPLQCAPSAPSLVDISGE